MRFWSPVWETRQLAPYPASRFASLPPSLLFASRPAPRPSLTLSLSVCNSSLSLTQSAFNTLSFLLSLNPSLRFLNPRPLSAAGTRRYTGESKRHAKTWEWATFADVDLDQYINLGAYMNASAYTVTETCLLEKAFSLFQVGRGCFFFLVGTCLLEKAFSLLQVCIEG